MNLSQSYTEEIEYSDKVVLPVSVSLELRINNLPLPPLMVLVPERPMQNIIYCSIHSFTAEEDTVYIPLWMYSELGYKSLNLSHSNRKNIKLGYGLKLCIAPFKESPNHYLVPKCTYIKVFCKEHAKVDDVKKALLNYRVVVENKEILLDVKNTKKSFRVVQVKPGSMALLSEDSIVEIGDKTNEPEEKIKKLPSIKEGNKSVDLEVIPQKPEKVPKFLMEIMNKKSTLALKSDSKKRSRTHHAPLFLFDDLNQVSLLANKHFKSPEKIKRSKNRTVMTTSRRSNDFEANSSPKVISFNLPSIISKIKKKEKSVVRSSVNIEKWFRPKNRKTSANNSSEFMPLDIIIQYKSQNT